MRLIRFFLGILLVPFCIAATLSLVSLISVMQKTGDWSVSAPVIALGGGLGAWLLVYFVLPSPVRSYVLAHELTHALWGAIMGASVSKIKVGEQSGSVTLSKTNWFITLAPYFFPLYTVLVVLGYYGLSLFYNVEKYHLVWLGLVGFTWGFHLVFTINTLMQRQSDIQVCGYLFSYTIIYLFNILGICFWVLVVSTVTLDDLLACLQADFGKVVVTMINWVYAFFRKMGQ